MESIIEVINGFEGSSIGEYQITGKTIKAAFKNEPYAKKDANIHDYNWHFAFGIKNRSDKPRKIEIYLNCDNRNGLYEKALIYGQKHLESDFQPNLKINALTDTYKKYFLEIDLDPNDSLYISNTYFRSPKLIQNSLAMLSQDTNCVKEIYGRSVEGRDLNAYIYSEEKSLAGEKPVFVITSGFHPMEADTFATEAIMEHLNSEEGRRLLKYFRFVVIPIVNPDGFAHGANGCNARGLNLYWNFKEKDKANAPEAYYLWHYLQQMKPSLYVDFHSYTFQLHRKKASPYLKPHYFYRGSAVKKLVEDIDRDLVALHNGAAERGPLTYAPSTLGYKLTRRWNTITYAKYHLHIMDGKEEYKRKAIKILDKIAGHFIQNGFTDRSKILAFPEGCVRDHFQDKVKRTLRVAWMFKIKFPLLSIYSKLKHAS